MWFRMLGPLEVLSNGRSIDLGGSKQRAALGFLLLQPNQVVPTSQLLGALWSTEEAPATARKILQNAIWGLRRRLADDGLEESVSLRTQAPGYTLDVVPEHVDLHRFKQLVAAGRAQLASGAPDSAASQLREALNLWRGNALADLVEVGFVWPELTTIQNTRLDVLEDYFEAELTSGRHYSVLGELESLVENAPLRERACGQLMRTLYLCGRQADALGVYGRLRTSLVEDLGLEPSRELQRLQQSILMQDPELQPAPQAAAVTVPAPRTPLDLPGGGDAPQAPPAHERQPSPVNAVDPHPVRQEISVLLVRTGLGPDHAEGSDTDSVLDLAGARTRQEIELQGGFVAASMGSDTLGLFPADPGSGDHAERAQKAALALRTHFACGPEPEDPTAVMPGAVVVRAAITTGEALLRRADEHGTPALSASGALLHGCQEMLPVVPAGEIQVCPTTHKATQDVFAYTQPDGSPLRWQLHEVARENARGGFPGLGAETAYGSELHLLYNLMTHVASWGKPHTASVLGASGAERTRMLMEFRRTAAANPLTHQVLFWCEPPAHEVQTFVLHRAILSAYCGLAGHDSPQIAQSKLESTLRRLVDDQGQAAWLAARLGPFINSSTQPKEGFGTREWLESWYQFLEFAGTERPLVLIMNDMHLANNATLDFIESLTDPARRLHVLVVKGFELEPPQHHGRPTNNRYTTVITMGSEATVPVRRLSDPFDLSNELLRVGQQSSEPFPTSL